MSFRAIVWVLANISALSVVGAGGACAKPAASNHEFALERFPG